MTPAEALTKLLPAWRAGLPPELDAHVDDYVERNREVLLGAIEQVLAIGRAKKGLPPRTVPEFLVYQTLAARALQHDNSDDKLAGRLVGRVERMRDDDDYEAAGVYGPAFAELRALALLLHGEHWAAVPLLLGRPVLAIGKDDGDARPQVLAVVDDRGRVHLRKVVLDDPPRWKALQHSLDVDLRNAKERVAALTAKIRAKTSLRRYAMTLWARARAEAEEAA